MTNALELPLELLTYLRKRAGHNGQTVQDALENLIRERMHYDAQLAKMTAPIEKFDLFKRAS